MKPYLQGLDLKQATLERLSQLDADNLPELAAYLHAAGDALGAFLPPAELAATRRALYRRLTQSQIAKATAPVQRFSFGARLEPRPPDRPAGGTG